MASGYAMDQELSIHATNSPQHHKKIHKQDSEILHPGLTALLQAEKHEFEQVMLFKATPEWSKLQQAEMMFNITPYNADLYNTKIEAVKNASKTVQFKQVEHAQKEKERLLAEFMRLDPRHDLDISIGQILITIRAEEEAHKKSLALKENSEKPLIPSAQKHPEKVKISLLRRLEITKINAEEKFVTFAKTPEYALLQRAAIALKKSPDCSFLQDLHRNSEEKAHNTIEFKQYIQAYTTQNDLITEFMSLDITDPFEKAIQNELRAQNSKDQNTTDL